MAAPVDPHHSKRRFSDRVEDYVRYRPSYPVDVVRILESEAKIAPAITRIVDLGCGTGISAQLFLNQGYGVTGVEPNPEMRDAAQRLLGSNHRFEIVTGSAEDTGLPESSFDLAIAAQAFHWFDRVAARLELERILVPSGVVALVWNERKVDASAFLRAYEDILVRYGTDYLQIDHRRVTDEEITAFFGPAGCARRVFPYFQELDLEGLIGRARSSSYVPGPGHVDHDAVLAALAAAFTAHADAGRVRFEYETKLYFGRFSR